MDPKVRTSRVYDFQDLSSKDPLICTNHSDSSISIHNICGISIQLNCDQAEDLVIKLNKALNRIPGWTSN